MTRLIQPASIAVLATLLAASPARAQDRPSGGPGRSETPDERSVQHACDPNVVRQPQAIRLLEVRSLDRIEEDLAFVDGINVSRDVLVVACRATIWSRFSALGLKPDARVLVQIRAWRKPADGGWLEMRLNDTPQDEAISKLQDERRYELREVNLVVTGTGVTDPRLVIPLRRELVKATDRVRIRIRIAPEGAPGPSADVEQRAVFSQNEDVIDSIYEVGRFGLHIRFSDVALFVQRMGEDRANNTGTSAVRFDSVNFRPAPGVNYGFNYYHRRHAGIRVLEPGFGMHLVFLNWNDRPRNATSADTDVTQVTNLQIGVGVTGSMFDGTVVGALGWNLHVKDHRPYVGLGFSITGLASKIAQFVRN
jgi:hypothetical protein